MRGFHQLITASLTGIPTIPEDGAEVQLERFYYQHTVRPNNVEMTMNRLPGGRLPDYLVDILLLLVWDSLRCLFRLHNDFRLAERLRVSSFYTEDIR